MNIQTISRKCQKSVKRSSLETTAGVRPRNLSWTIATTIQSNPTAMCNPCVPTSVKNAERNALVCQLAPTAIKR